MFAVIVLKSVLIWKNVFLTAFAQWQGQASTTFADNPAIGLGNIGKLLETLLTILVSNVSRCKQCQEYIDRVGAKSIKSLVLGTFKEMCEVSR